MSIWAWPDHTQELNGCFNVFEVLATDSILNEVLQFEWCHLLNETFIIKFQSFPKYPKDISAEHTDFITQGSLLNMLLQSAGCIQENLNLEIWAKETYMLESHGWNWVKHTIKHPGHYHDEVFIDVLLIVDITYVVHEVGFVQDYPHILRVLITSYVCKGP